MDKFVIRTKSSENNGESATGAGCSGGAATQKRKNQSGQELNKKIREDFDSNWLRIYPWLEQSEDTNGKTIMFCSWCKNANKKNIFTTGTQSFKKQTLECHLNIDDHKIAAVAKDKSQVSIVQGFTRQLGEEKLKIIGLMRNTYYLSKNGQALNLYPELCHLVHLQINNQNILQYQ